MSVKEIIICTTMRDFSGSDNDLIQLRFLDSLKAQLGVRVILVVTLFGEKRVEEEVLKIFNDAVFYHGAKGDFRYSLTQVINNAIDFKDRIKKSSMPIFWTTCDVVYESDFILKCLPYLKSKSMVTSHPHKIVSLNESSVEVLISNLDSGFDMLIFSNDFIDDLRFREVHNIYVFKDWGVYEHFLISLHELVQGAKLYNIFEESVVAKIENNRTLTNEPNQFITSSHKRNSVVFRSYLKDLKISRDYFNLVYCHFRFCLTKNKYRHYICFYRDVFSYVFSYKLRGLFSSILPNFAKDIIKRYI